MNEGLPEMYEATLDGPALDALVDDIARDTTVLAVLTKGGAEALAEGGGVTLHEAAARLRAGRVRAVQVRYAHRGAVWMDTLLATSAGVRRARFAAPRG